MLLDPVLSKGLPRFAFPTNMEIKSDDSLARSGNRYRPRKSLSDRVSAALFTLTKGKAAILSHHETPWASITFSGTRHEIVLDFKGSEAVAVGEDFIANLPEHEFTIPAQLVAEATVTEVDHRFGEDERLIVTAVLLLLEEV
ncbi:MAG: hypothetical protein AAGL10_04635 [Pseudomonadota bacterium]